MRENNPNPALHTRQLALQAIQTVMQDHASLDEFLARNQTISKLSHRDRAYVLALCGVSLRHVGTVKQIVRQLLRKPLPGKARRANYILMCGLAELLFLASAPHGVVHSWVELAARSMKSRPFKGLINGVLRNADRQRDQLLAKNHVVDNIPEPLRTAWTDQYGADIVAQAAMALAEPPPLDITLLRNSARWRDELGGANLSPTTVRLPRQGAVENLPGYTQGDWIVQDAAAALPVQLLHVQAGENVLDMCAAPGGKTMQMAALGARVTAIEMSAMRVQTLQENLARTGLSAQLVEGDAANWQENTPFDAILVDAPCSASGIFRHHPDVLYSFASKDVDALVQTQLSITRNAARLLKPGGRMVYCVCSAQAIEGEDVLERILASCDLVLDPVQPEAAGPAKAFVNEAGCVRIPPGALADQGGMDAFFMARLRKPGGSE